MPTGKIVPTKKNSTNNTSEILVRSVREAEQEIVKGETYSHAQVMDSIRKQIRNAK